MQVVGLGCERYQGLTMGEQAQWEMVKFEIERLATLEEISWCQKSRALWLEGDSNTRL
jgi:hypothetical protein